MRHELIHHGVALRLVRGDVTEADVDAVVNAANSSLLGGGGVDGAIHRRGGPAILKACRALRKSGYPDGLPTGAATTTTAGDLPARAVIHAVGPVWRGGQAGEADLLRRTYAAALAEARTHGFRSVAFPSISTGAYGYPVGPAAAVALGTVLDVAAEHADAYDEIRFVLFSDDDLATYARALGRLADALPGA